MGRLADGAANPYLLQASVLAAGLWGLEKGAKGLPNSGFMPPSINMYTLPDSAPELVNIQLLPRNLLDALRLLEQDKELKALLGERFVQAFLKIKNEEWSDY